MQGLDQWLTTDIEGERRQLLADYCAENHPEYEGDSCHLCEAEEAHWNEGPDPDDARDMAREIAEEERND